jgi:hypothetical protein
VTDEDAKTLNGTFIDAAQFAELVAGAGSVVTF